VEDFVRQINLRLGTMPELKTAGRPSPVSRTLVGMLYPQIPF
jgi:hypothetical protein